MKRVWEFVREHPLIIAIAVLFVAYQLFGDALPSINLEQALEDISDSLGQWTYAVVGALAFLETGAFVGLVFPGETAVVLAGAIAGNGTTSIVVTIAVVWVCAWLGDTASFLLGQKLGKEFILKHGPRVRITPERFGQVEDYFDRYGGRTILVGRFIGLVRALAPFIAGSSGMSYRSFAPYSVLGTGLWAATFSILGYVLAENIEKAEDL
ncbi:MAG TPA: DedA family protein, partial [Solirubrobacterales bacterium]|nr:DedA family protein [Solirubrobacterales bacterium]